MTISHAYERNDQALERMNVDDCFKTATRRLEKLFDMFMKITTRMPT